LPDDILKDLGTDLLSGVGDLIFTEGQGDIGFIPSSLTGKGWVEIPVTSYYKGQKKVSKGFTKKYKDLTPMELNGYWMGYRRARAKWVKKKNAAYRAGFNKGAKAQQTAERVQESGGTPLVRYMRRR